MYIRFVVSEISEESGHRLGIFHAARYLKDGGEFTRQEFEVADGIMGWFACNLESPLDFLNRQRSAGSEYYISWFKPEAKEHIMKARVLADVLESKDIIVEQIKTKNPGKIVYEDEYQIYAKPFDMF